MPREMNRNEKIEYILSAIARSDGDDLERAQHHFRGLTPVQMQEQHGQSGKTRQQILDEYVEYRLKNIEAREFFKALCKERH